MGERTATEAILDLLTDYCDAIDSDRLEEWPEMFVDDCRYEILSRENVALGLPAPIVYCNSKGMLLDRVTALREALTFEFQYARHLVTNTRVRSRDDGGFAVTSNYLVLQTDEDGVTRIFGTGRYEDEIVFRNGAPKFKRRSVIMDSYGIHNLLALPI